MCMRKTCKTCKTYPSIHKVQKISGPKRSIKIIDHFTCIPANAIYCITCTLCKKLYISETGRRLGGRFREHLRNVEKDDKNASKPVERDTFMNFIIVSNVWHRYHATTNSIDPSFCIKHTYPTIPRFTPTEGTRIASRNVSFGIS